jgi:hypothetical protein
MLDSCFHRRPRTLGGGGAGCADSTGSRIFVATSSSGAPEIVDIDLLQIDRNACLDKGCIDIHQEVAFLGRQGFVFLAFFDSGNELRQAIFNRGSLRDWCSGICGRF